MQQVEVGIFGIGLEAYWEQFEGLRDRLEGYQQSVEERISRWATVVSPGLVDTAPKGQEPSAGMGSGGTTPRAPSTTSTVEPSNSLRAAGAMRSTCRPPC
jgi:hypothetical protein